MSRFPFLAPALACSLLSTATAFAQEVKLSNVPDLPHQVVKGWAKLPAGWNLGECSGVSVDRNDNVWVFNRGSHPVVQFDKNGNFLRSWSEVPVLSSHGIKVDPYGDVWAVDVKGHTIFEFSPEGRIKMVIGLASRREGNNESRDAFHEPTGIAFSNDGFYVSDGYKNSRVVKFDREGIYQYQWGTKGTGDGQFDLVHDVALDKQGRVYVADRNNSRVQVFDARGKFIAKWTDAGQPWGLAYHERDNAIYMADGRDNRIVKLDLDGKPQGKLSGYGKVEGKLDFAHHIAVDSEGSIYVAEIKNWRVQKFAAPRR